MGSKSDMPEMEKAGEVLAEKGIHFEIRVMSAHRDPDMVADYCRNARMRGLQVIIAGAGLSAALPGVAAAHSDLPVIGVPLSSRLSAMGGLDAILSIVQMPPGRARSPASAWTTRATRATWPRASSAAEPGAAASWTSRGRSASWSALAFELFGRHLATFLSLTLIVVAPVVILVDGVWGGYLADGGRRATPRRPPAGASLALGTVVIPPLVTALQVVVVQALARGEEPTVGAALRRAAPRLLSRRRRRRALQPRRRRSDSSRSSCPGVWLSVRLVLRARRPPSSTDWGPSDALRRSAEAAWRPAGGGRSACCWPSACSSAIFGAVAGAVIRHASTTARSTTSAQVLAPGRAAVADRDLRDAAVLRFARPRARAVAGPAAAAGPERAGAADPAAAHLEFAA